MFAIPAARRVSDQWDDQWSERTSTAPTPINTEFKADFSPFASRKRYLITLCRALMLYGAPTHRLEEYMGMSARVLGMEAQFLYLPSYMIISFDHKSSTELKIVRESYDIDLNKLQDVYNAYKDVLHDILDIEEATKILDNVMVRKPKFPTWVRIAMYGLASVCACPVAFGGRFVDLPFAFLLGSIMGVLHLIFAASNELYAYVFEVTTCIITSFLARAAGSYQNGEMFCFSALAQSCLAIILPGFMILCSSLELQSHNMISGSVRLVYAIIFTLLLGYGMTIGAALYGMLDPNASSATHCAAPAMNRAWHYLFVSGFTLSVSVVCQGEWKQLPMMLIIAMAGFVTNRFSSPYFEGSSQIPTILSALTIGILSNLYSRLGRHVERAMMAVVSYIKGRFQKKSTRPRPPSWPLRSHGDAESGRPWSMMSNETEKPNTRTGYSLALGAMLPAILLQVPGSLAAGGSLLAGIKSADQIAGQGPAPADGSSSMNTMVLGVLFTVIQIDIGLSVGLLMSALIVYPLGKSKSAVFSM